jgi:sulfoxide reductase heme-binding subunit YedZ
VPHSTPHLAALRADGLARPTASAPASRRPASSGARTDGWIGAAKMALFLVCLVPFTLLVWDGLNDQLGANPVQTVTHQTGLWGLRLLLVTLTVTPLRRLTGWGPIVRFRRMLGLFAFFYALLHFLTYVVIDQGLALHDILEDVAKRPYVTIGFTGFVLLVPLAATSTDGMIRRLGGKRWKQLHQLVYVTAVAGCLHYLWLVKADTLHPLIYLSVLLVLLVLRAPALQKVTLRRSTPPL